MFDGALQVLVARKTDGVQEILFFQKRVEVRVGKRGVTSEESADIRISVTGHDWLQHTVPIVGAVDLALAKQCTFQISELIEAEQGVIAGAAKVSVVRRAFLSTIGLTDRKSKSRINSRTGLRS